MADPLQIMVMPAAVDGAPPQVLFDDGGIWRDTTPGLYDSKKPRSDQMIQSKIADAMKQVGRQPIPVAINANGLSFRSTFADLYNEFLSPEVRALFKRAKQTAGGAAPQLNIYFRKGTEWVPWELFHDGDGFLGVQFAIARLPIVPEATEIRPPRNCVVQKVYSLLGKDVLNGTVLQNWETTFDGFTNQPNWASRFPANGAANYPMLTQLDEARDASILHITCHGGLKEQGSDYFWSLDDQNPQFFDYRIDPAIARTAQLRGRPLVFGNACASAQSTDLNALTGFGPSFMIGGALNFVGTFAPITKTMAVEFARSFYLNLFGTAGQPGKPIAEALRVTKEALANLSDPSYLFYCLYGPADSTYRPV